MTSRQCSGRAARVCGPAAGGGWEEVGVAEQAGGVGVAGVVEDVRRGAVVAELPPDEQGGVVRQGEGLVAVVGDQDGGGAVVVERGAQVGDQVGARGGVEAGEGLVEQQDPRARRRGRGRC